MPNFLLRFGGIADIVNNNLFGPRLWHNCKNSIFYHYIRNSCSILKLSESYFKLTYSFETTEELQIKITKNHTYAKLTIQLIG